MKYLGKAFAVVAVAAMALTGCGRAGTPDPQEPAPSPPASEGTSGGDVTLSMWGIGAEGELLPEFLEQYTAETGVKVEVTAIPWGSAYEKIQTSIAAGTGPDLAQMTWMPQFGHAFETVPADFDTSDIFEASLNVSLIDGEQKGIPWYVDTRVLYYRADLAAKAGWDRPPATWEELRQMAKDLKESGIEYPIRLPTADNNAFMGTLFLLWSAGGGLLNADETAWTIDTPEARRAYEYYASFFKDGLANPDADTSDGADTAEFIAGTTAIFMSGPWMRAQFRQLGGEDFEKLYATAPVPKDVSGTSYVGGTEMVVYKGTQHSEEAWKLIKWFNQPETQVKWFHHGGGLPSRISAWGDPSLVSDEKLAAFGKQMEDMKSEPVVQKWPEVSAEGDRFLERLARGVVDPATGLAELQASADAIGVE